MSLREKERWRGAPARIAELAIMAVALAFVCVTLLGAGPASAQSQPAGVYKLNYFNDVDQGFSQSAGVVRITNPGSTTAGAAVIPPEPPAVCALIYVYRPDEQLAECCGCWVSRNGLREIDVSRYLTSNPLTYDPLPRGVLKIVSSYTPTGQPPTSDAQCDARTITPTRTLRAWITHPQPVLARGELTVYTFTETEFTDASLSDDEKATLEYECYSAWRLGSGRGRCSCPPPPGP